MAGAKPGRRRERGPARGAAAPRWATYAAAGAAALAACLALWGRGAPPAPEAARGSAAGAPDEPDLLDLARGNLFRADGSSNFDSEHVRGEDGVSRFAREEYWDERYSKEADKDYDWYGTWSTHSSGRVTIAEHVRPAMPATVASILNVGCGNSRLPDELSKDGYTDIFSIDISQAAIDLMSERFADDPALRFARMDVTNMSFAGESFDVVFEKGTLDALYTGVRHLVKFAVADIYRVLKPGGLFVSMTFGTPDQRIELNMTTENPDAPTWDRFQTFQMRPKGGSSMQVFYLFLMTK